MKYRQKVDKVCTEEIFPYPIKCWYDNNHVYLQPLRIPTLEEIEKSSNREFKIHKEGTLYLVLENKCKERHRTGRKAFFTDKKTEVIYPVIKDNIYTFDIPMTRMQEFVLNKHGNCYITLRGSYRFGNDENIGHTGITSNTVTIYKEI